MNSADRADAPAAREGALRTLPCPFCGRKPTVNRVRAGTCQLHGERLYTHVVSCADHATFSHPSSREDAVELWNRRADPAPAAPAPGAEAERRDLGPAKYEFGRALKDAFVAAPTWEDFAERGAAVLARLGAAQPADPAHVTLLVDDRTHAEAVALHGILGRALGAANPARASLGGAVRVTDEQARTALRVWDRGFPDNRVHRMRQALHCAALAAEGGDGWRPIETAPKDGTIVIAAYNDHPTRPAYWDGSCWITIGCITEGGEEPYFWQPLPKMKTVLAPPAGREA